MWKQLQELALSNNIKHLGGLQITNSCVYRHIVEHLKNLRVLELRMPTVEKVDLGKIKGNIGGLWIGDLGCSFLPHNLPGLKALWIRYD